MRILGISGESKRAEDDDIFMSLRHDSAAVLIVDGHVVAAVEEERLNRIKHSNCFPVNAIRSCLEIGNTTLAALDAIVLSNEASAYEEWTVYSGLGDPTLPAPTDGTSFVEGLFHRFFGASVRPVLRFCHHQKAHAWSAYGVSGFQDALVLTIDGMGDNSSGMVLRASEGGMEVLRKLPIHHSLGILYNRIITLLGFRYFDEYKAMGLAPYGNPDAYEDVFQKGYRLLEDGHYVIQPIQWWYDKLGTVGLLRRARRTGEPFTQEHMDIAAGLQSSLERIVLHVLKHFARTTGLRSLCLAGGVAHNCSMNGKILRSELFDRVFVQPASHDAGGALGAALSVAAQEVPKAPFAKMSHVYLGPELGPMCDVERTLRLWSDFISIERPTDLANTVARKLAGGAVIGWVQGRSEFGPRALGNRSILADPRPAENKQRINAMIKKRESYRPFAPAVMEERASEFFDIPATEACFSFMTFVVPVKEHVRGTLGAVTHVDGTARIQTVSRSQNVRFWELLNAFDSITGLPLLLNTSFNNNAEPIVDSLEDALACFLTTGLEYLIAGDFLVSKKAVLDMTLAAGTLCPLLMRSCRLEKTSPVVSRADSGGSQCAVVRAKHGYFSRPCQAISSELFFVLARADGSRSLDSLIADLQEESQMSRSALINEVIELWGQRLISMSPCPEGIRLQ